MNIELNKKLLEDYKKIVDISSIVAKIDLEGIITYANNNFCNISGYSLGELVGKPHDIVCSLEEDSSEYKDLWKAMHEKKVWQGYLKSIKKSGEVYYVFATVMPFIDENGDVYEYISLRKDVTELQLLTNQLEIRVSQEIEKNQKKDKEAIDNLNLFLDSTPNSIIVYDGKKVAFANKSFVKLVGIQKKFLIDEEFDFTSLLDNTSGFITKEEEFVLRESNKVSITIHAKRNIFSLFYEEIESSAQTTLKMYTLNNITANEYHKFRLKNYNELLQKYYIHSKKPTDKIVQIEPKKPIVEEIYDLFDIDDTIDESSKTVRELNDKEKELLKRQHKDLAVSSQEYSCDIDEYILEEIHELGDIEHEINNYIHELEMKNMGVVGEIVSRLLKFSSVLNSLVEFKELSFSINSLANVLDNSDISKLDETTYKKMTLFLSNIILDFSTWRNIIFVEQSANDIHYMDSSLFSSILQFELLFNDDQKYEEEDDFELF